MSPNVFDVLGRNQPEEPSAPAVPVEAFRFTDVRQQRIYRRLRVVGPGPAAFFRDACRLMSLTPQLESTTHLVAHLLREIESAVRKGVLEPFRQQAIQAGDQIEEGENHRNQIVATLRALKIPEDHPVWEAWLRLAGRRDDALAGRAHRDNLAAPRPLDAQFLKFWDDTQGVLEVVLDRFEAGYLQVHRALDDLVKKATPTIADANWIRLHIPNNLMAMGELFYRLNNPAWIEPLKAEGFFDDPIAPDLDQEKGILTHTRWPQLRFLARMASNIDVQQTILEILLAIETENLSIHEDVIEVALQLPAGMASQLVNKERVWIATQPHLFHVFAEKVGRLVAHLASNGEVETALEFLATALAVGPDPREAGNDNKARFWHPKPVTRINDWEYRVIVKGAMPSLIVAAGIETLELFAGLLETAVSFSRRPEERELFNDYSDIWRTDIENLSRHGIEDVLVSVVRDAAVQFAELQREQIPAILAALESHRWSIFRRLSLHVLRKYPHRDLIIARLLNRANFNERTLWSEYSTLAKEQFHLLSPEQQEELLGWIDEGPDPELIKDNSERWFSEKLSDQEAQDYIVRSKLRKLEPLKDVLPPKWKGRYDKWSQELRNSGEASDIEDLHPQVMRGLQTPKTREELSEMSAEDIVSFLANWKRPPDGLQAPVPAGLGYELSATVAENPASFAAKAHLFKGLDPTYVRSYLTGIKEGAKNGPIEWRDVLALCSWVLDQPRESASSDESEIEQDRDWIPTRQEIVGLLLAGFEKGTGKIPFQLRSEVWSVLRPLTEDPDPTPEKEASSGPATDWVDISLNTIRGRALQAVVGYALWAVDHQKLALGIDAGKANGFDAMPEVRDVLERHLDPEVDPSLAIRSVYGRWLLSLISLDAGWTENNLARIFPTDNRKEALLNAAWNSYVRLNNVFPNFFPVLATEYTRAVERLDLQQTGENDYRENPDERLAEHVMMLYAHGKILQESPDGLLNGFYDKASGNLRGYAIRSVGSAFRDESSEIPEEVISRFKLLWQSRIETAKRSNSLDDYQQELKAFGWLFASRRFESEWALTQLRAVLELTGTIGDDDQTIEYLAELSEDNTEVCLECAKLLLENVTDEWKISLWAPHIRKILASGLANTDESISLFAADIVNRLAAWRTSEFQDLLSLRSVKYFAYGSNMLTKRLRNRVPSAKFSAVTTLTKHCLKFHKVSTDKKGNRSGKCNAYLTGKDEDVVYGVVFEIDRNELKNLAAAEVGYSPEVLTLTQRGKAEAAFMFSVTDESLLSDSLRPYAWYKELVLAGAREHNLPAGYIREIENVLAIADPDKDRDQQNRRFLL